MSTMQWMFLVGGIVVVTIVALYTWHKERNADLIKEPKRKHRDEAQLDLLGAMPEEDNSDREFDEFGVGKPRTKRVEPSIDSGDEASGSESAVKDGGMPSAGKFSSPNGQIDIDDMLAPSVEQAREPAPESNRTASADEVVVVLYLAESEGTEILGPQLHDALNECGLKFGENRVYHRLQMVDGTPQSVFSVANLVNPGFLDPAEAEDFHTPGLCLFMRLPGAQDGFSAFGDLLNTADVLATRLNAKVLDKSKQPMTREKAEEIHRQIVALAQNTVS